MKKRLKSSNGVFVSEILGPQSLRNGSGLTGIDCDVHTTDNIIFTYCMLYIVGSMHAYHSL